MGKKLIALLLIVCIIAPSLFAVDTDDVYDAVAPFFTLGTTGIIVGSILGIGLLTLVTVAAVVAEADVPSDGLYLVSDDGSVANPSREKDSIFDHIMPVIDYRPSPAGNNQTHIGIRLSF